VFQKFAKADRKMAKQQSLYAYEDRYKKVFDAGGINWNNPKPNSELDMILKKIPQKGRCIEFGCGEGYQSRFVASKGFNVIGIDLSISAIMKAQRETPIGMAVSFIVGDITEKSLLSLIEGTFDLAIDIGCLHMMAEQEDRNNYLSNVWSILNERGLFYIQEGIDLQTITPESIEEAEQIKQLKEIQTRPTGTLLSRTITTIDNKKQIELPLCPKGKILSLEGYIDELKENGFKMVSAKRKGGANQSYEAIILSRKHITSR